MSGKLMATNSTHVKANASRSSEHLVEIQEEPGVYWERLDRYEEEGLSELERRTGKHRAKRTKQIKRDKRRTHKRVSRTDPEAGHMKRPEKPRGQYYLSHQTTDTDCGIITGVTVTPRNVYDSVPYLEQLEHIHRNVIPVQTAAADSAYDFPLAHRVLEEQGITFFVRPQTAHDRTNVELKRNAFSYDMEQDTYICPTGKQLRLNTLHRSGSGIWLADMMPITGVRSKSGRFGARVLLPLRNGGHNLTRILRRGLEAAEDHCLLSATALNLKRMIKRLG